MEFNDLKRRTQIAALRGGEYIYLLVGVERA